MQNLQRAIEEALGEIPERILTQIVAQKLKAQGIVLSKKEQRKLINHILEKGSTSLKFRGWQFWKREQGALIEFTPEDSDKIDELGEKVADALPRIVESVSSSVADDILKTLTKTWPRELRRQNTEFGGFRKRLFVRWGHGIGGLRMLLTISREFGASINQEIRETTAGSGHLPNVLLRLHARSCQIVEEILCLLSAGLADGAMARWRTLDEIAVVAFFLHKHGEGLAERYAFHQCVESWKAAQKYQECCERLHYEPIEPDEMTRIKALYDAAIARYGSSFRGDYGWAAPAFQNKDPKFGDIEKAAGLDHLRAHYRMAGHNVHGNPKGAFFKLGLLAGTNLLLAGPSSAGLANPGHCAALSLAQVSTTLFDLHPNFDNLVALRMMLRLEEEIGQAFLQAHQKLIQDEAKHHSES